MHYPIVPTAKPRMTQRDRWKKRPSVLKYFAFKDECRARNVQLPEVGIRVIYGVPMPKSWSKKKKEEMDWKPHQQTPDLDNLNKALCDAVLDDDSRIWNMWGSKIWSREGFIFILPITKCEHLCMTAREITLEYPQNELF